jgi:hypothetical protein
MYHGSGVCPIEQPVFEIQTGIAGRQNHTPYLYRFKVPSANRN